MKRAAAALLGAALLLSLAACGEAPGLTELPDVVALCDTSLQSEWATLMALEEECLRQSRTHRVIVMADLGDLREGFWDKDELVDVCQRVEQDLPHVHLAGIGVNLSCYGSTKPTPDKMNELVALAHRVEARIGRSLEVVSGGAVFPTGKVYEMSGEKGSLLDGMGAIELRALYPGETVIRAQAEGVPPVELQLLVTGDSPWDGRELVPLPAPPSVMGPPPRQALDEIGLYRPVFASGEDPQCPAKNVTDGQWETCWKPASPEAGQWVMVDLEGTKDVEGIHVVFRGMVQHAVEVALSHTREDFRTIYNSGERPAVTDVSLDNLGQQARFIRVRFPGEATPICKIEVFA